MTKQPPSESGLKDLIVSHIRQALRRYTPIDLARTLSAQYNIPVKLVRRSIKALLEENRLVYTHLLGHSFLEISYRRPVDVGGGVILAPADAACQPAPGQVWIRIAPGAAFGMGDHATTRLALQLMSWSIGEQNFLGDVTNARALDIGTGSGVLAIGACRMGFGKAVGTDLDACARVEAAENARLNELGNRVQILVADLNLLSGSFSLILANLRYPTLTALRDQILELAAPQALLILSGFREHELPGLLAAYASDRVVHLRTQVENAWAGIAMLKSA